MLHSLRAFPPAALLLAAGLLFSTASRAQNTPKELQPPAGEQSVQQVHATGVQIYSCKSDAGQFSWVLKAPDALLTGIDGKPFGKHFAGPSWEANDGSRITGKAVVNVPSPGGDSIPWLLVTVVSRSGDGTLSRVSSIQRINTKGGKSPASGCDAARADQEIRVPYSADYVFFAPGTPAH
jgi:hypothetical protein